MTPSLLLTLRFQPQRRASSCSQVAAVVEDLEALYFAVPRAIAHDETVQQHLALEHRARMESILGDSGALLAEIEYRTRALRQLEISGAPEDAVEFLRRSVDVLARAELQRTVLSSRSEPPRVDQAPLRALELRRMSMRSPLELVVSIPPEYWLGPAFFTFLAAVERRFNMVGRIKLERKTIQAEEAGARAEEREAEAREREASLRIARAQEALAVLAQREEQDAGEMKGEGEALAGLAPGHDQFALEEGLLKVDPKSSGTTRKGRTRSARDR